MMLIFFSSDGRNGFRFSQPKTTAAGIRGLRKISPQIMITAPSPTTPSAAAILGDGGGVRPDAHVDRGARIAGGCGDPADVLGHLGAANGNQLRRVGRPSSDTPPHGTATVRSCEKIGWQAKAPAPQERKPLRTKVGQTLSSV